jgi:glucose-6-phosphate 1-epimerase
MPGPFSFAVPTLTIFNMHPTPHAIPDRVAFQPGNGGLQKVLLSTPASQAELYLHGAHVTHFQITGQPPVLFLSSQSNFHPDKPIRGGVPICFPWFGPRTPDPAGNSPMHGFARILPWDVVSTSADGDTTSIELSLIDNSYTRNTWPHPFRAAYHVSLSPAALALTLTVTNTGPTPFRFEEALHTYFAIADARNATVEGLDGAEYLDKTDHLARKRQSGPVTITAETDRVYLDSNETCVIRDAAQWRSIFNVKQNSHATVVWNPWIAKSKAMPDFGDEEWQRMLCVETANAGPHAVTLPPGKTHTMSATIRPQSQ